MTPPAPDVHAPASQAPAGDARRVDVLVVGGGQAGLAAGYHLRRLARDAARGRGGPAPSFAILDAAETPGGSWLHYWDSLRLFSPAETSSLPGWRMPAWPGPDTPSADHVVAYLTEYERRYELPVHRPVTVLEVADAPDGGFAVRTDRGDWHARAVISATGSWTRPFLPHLPGAEDFAGRQLHTVDYRRAEDFAGQRMLVVGGGNSGAQIAADLAPGARALTWATRRPPRWMPDDVDGAALFRVASARVRSSADPGGQAGPDGRENGEHAGVGALGDIVVLPPVRRAREAGLLVARPMPERLTADGAVWADGSHEPLDDVVWCTCFRPALGHLRPLRLTRRGDVPAMRQDPPTASADRAGLFLLGYGDWCGPASATLVGVGAPARATAAAAAEHLRTTEA